ncbi:hypothetical protein D0B54_02345 [Solimonas sp. K1W22B-7]|uniref:hypothetical protein n=1 Tax=Solimonas sp. K1W22B-7 TaxID=2303331 RepID=UPI000E32D5D8|nr:hypothetical protein [Solimonas sp. K1W22B-7]AXQ27581.1 hypothetical protein D0B54_02345 [Solimonas sp. K1W22B-7]
MDIGLGWSVETRRTEIGRVVDALVSVHGYTRAEAVDLLSRRMGAGFNTVEGWISGGGEGSRSPPPWQAILLLQYELGLRPVLELTGWGRGRKPATTPNPRARRA